MNFRTGFGYDVHALVAGRDLVLGGITIEHPFGLQGHSDADVLIHALCDALLGAASLRDIGFHFPDSSSVYKDIDSKILLHQTIQLLREKGYELGNADMTLCAEAPKINPYIEKMQLAMAHTMQVDPEQLSIKATTTERLGFVGKQEGMAAYCTVLIYKN